LVVKAQLAPHMTEKIAERLRLQLAVQQLADKLRLRLAAGFCLAAQFDAMLPVEPECDRGCHDGQTVADRKTDARHNKVPDGKLTADVSRRRPQDEDGWDILGHESTPIDTNADG
jgi:hypothetical protein